MLHRYTGGASASQAFEAVVFVPPGSVFVEDDCHMTEGVEDQSERSSTDSDLEPREDDEIMPTKGKGKISREQWEENERRRSG
jgi:hypothetical protein